jgi:hypothetical protein
MIAIFAKSQRDIDQMIYSPKRVFINIKNARAIYGRTFTGIILIPGWYTNDEVAQAYGELMKRQPKLFLHN